MLNKTTYLPNFFLRVFTRIFFKKPPVLLKDKKSKILVYQVGNIGDLTVSTPVYRALREKFPLAEITLLSSSGSKKYVGAEEIIKPLNYVDNIQSFFPEDFASLKTYYYFFQAIKKGKYDLVVYLPSNLWKTFHIFRDMVFFSLTGIKYGTGFQMFEDYHNYLNHNVLPRNEVQRLFDLLKPIGIESGNKKTEFAVSKESLEFVQGFLSRHKISKKTNKIAVMPAGKYSSRLWPKQYFIKLIDRINENFSVEIILIGSEFDKKLAEEIKQCTKMKPLNTTGSLKINQVGALLKNCNLLITNDTGPMHIAAAIGVPTVSIFSGVDIPFLWYPSGDNHKIFYNKVACSPCFQQNCNKHICMEGIPVDRVYDAVVEQLEKIGIHSLAKP